MEYGAAGGSRTHDVSLTVIDFESIASQPAAPLPLILVLLAGNDPTFIHYQCIVIPLYYKSELAESLFLLYEK